ncbi:MAG: SDR family NAD(P)-dependent oxidoreductase [Parvibaculaceae bacterium]|nr:SDR family NAD(P)-dependent oxidoreductase [Parvibaculaceae bacterium]HBM87404.1 KR domain-containing protein [Rhodobiaceae bacterium]|tara:strand:+ start:2835 stop:3572 length:738 start_codon:yes stop_codon:yes gene_type:complete
MTRPICLIVGVGDATGTFLVRRFVEGGYDVAMIARNAERLAALTKEIPHTHAYVCDVSDLKRFESILDQISEELGRPHVVIHNAVSHTFDTFLNADPEDFEHNFRVNATSLLTLARHVAPAMIEAGEGSLVVTGNTASHRGVPKYALFAPTKAAQRVLAEAMARDLGPKGIHVAYVTVDAAIDVTWFDAQKEDATWLMPPEGWPHARVDFFAHPAAIADEVFHVAHQDRSTWSFDLVIRPFAETW